MALRGTLTHRKTRRLAKALGIDPPFALGILEALWHVASENQHDGGIGRMSNEDIAEEMHYSGNADELIAALLKSGWLDDVENSVEKGRLYVHDWHEHADDSTKSKLIQWTKLFANGEPPSLRKLSEKARANVIAKYEIKFGPFIGQKMRCVRTESDGAHGAHDAHIQKPESRSQSPEARVQKPDLPENPPPPPEPPKNLHQFPGQPQYTQDETYLPIVAVAAEFWPDSISEDFTTAHFAWNVLSWEQKQEALANLIAKNAAEPGRGGFVKKNFANYMASAEWKRKAREPTQAAQKTFRTAREQQLHEELMRD